MARITSEAAKLRIAPANEVSWDDLLAVVGAARCHADPCFCQRFKIVSRQWRSVSDEERAYLLRTPGRVRSSGFRPTKRRVVTRIDL